ncbi:MAG TPA: peptidoglycan-binding protein [Pyrinomonadaceae bacterium]|nr:peptidoglycan-binding protein [Pyrinomonadaceae bacterium]
MALTDLIPIPAGVNPGLSVAHQLTMKTLLGLPRENFGQDCRSITNPTLKALVTTANVGPFVVTGLAPAVESLKEVMDDIRQAEPEIFAALGSSGMLCARFVRGSTVSISNHSWGTAIDLNLNGVLDARGDGVVQVGMSRIAPIFNQNGWAWGAGFPKEDGMHFELSDEKIRALHAAGVFGAGVTAPTAGTLSLGDRGPAVKELQQKLNGLGNNLTADGVFGPATHAAVIAFQAQNGLTPDGLVGPRTRAKLGL